MKAVMLTAELVCSIPKAERSTSTVIYFESHSVNAVRIASMT